MPAVTEILPVERFRDALRAAAEVVPVSHSRLGRLLANPRSPPRLLRAFAAKVHHGALQFPGLLAALVAHAPDPLARAVLLENLLEEQGFQIIPGKGLVALPEQCHGEWSAHFVRVCGGDPRTVEMRSDATLGHARINALLQAGRWLEAVAYLLAGQETIFGKACFELVEVLRRRGFNDSDIVFFSRHAVADQQHGNEAVELIATRAKSAAQQRAAVEAAAAGARHWRSQYEFA